MNNFRFSDPAADAEAYYEAQEAESRRYLLSLPRCCCCGEPILTTKCIEIEGEKWCAHCEHVNAEMLWDEYARHNFLVRTV